MFGEKTLNNLQRHWRTALAVGRRAHGHWRQFIDTRWRLVLFIVFISSFVVGIGMKIVAREYSVIGYDDYRVVADPPQAISIRK